jgi:hypothetical protein
MKFEPIFLCLFNFAARLFGALAILTGIAFFVSAYATKDNRALDICVGTFVLLMGLAVLRAKSAKSKDLDGMRPPPS